MVTRKYIRDYKLSESVTERGWYTHRSRLCGEAFRICGRGLGPKMRASSVGGVARGLAAVSGGAPAEDGGFKAHVGHIAPLHFPRLPLGYMDGFRHSAVAEAGRRGSYAPEAEKLSKRLPVRAFGSCCWQASRRWGWALLLWPRRRA